MTGCLVGLEDYLIGDINVTHLIHGGQEGDDYLLGGEGRDELGQ